MRGKDWKDLKIVSHSSLSRVFEIAIQKSMAKPRSLLRSHHRLLRPHLLRLRLRHRRLRFRLLRPHLLRHRLRFRHLRLPMVGTLLRLRLPMVGTLLHLRLPMVGTLLRRSRFPRLIVLIAPDSMHPFHLGYFAPLHNECRSELDKSLRWWVAGLRQAILKTPLDNIVVPANRRGSISRPLTVLSRIVHLYYFPTFQTVLFCWAKLFFATKGRYFCV